MLYYLQDKLRANCLCLRATSFLGLNATLIDHKQEKFINFIKIRELFAMNFVCRKNPEQLI